MQIPWPERFAIHKLIVADCRQGRPDQAKARKDRAQAAFLIEALAADRPEDLCEAWEDALSRGPRRRTRLASSLDLMPQTEAVLDGLR